MLTVGDKRTVINPVIHSDAKHLAGQIVTILLIDEREWWEDPVVYIQPTTGQATWMNPKDFAPSPLAPLLDKVAHSMGGFRFDDNDPFGGLPVIAPLDRAVSDVYSDDCYTCCDPDFAARGLPLCRACPACGGHIAADDSVCNDCGLDDSFFWQFVGFVVEGGDAIEEDLTIYTRRMFLTPDYKPKDPTVKELHRATVVLKRELKS